MKLTRAQRTALFAGTPVKITFPGDEDCPVKEGHVEVLSANVRLEVTAIDKAKDRKTGDPLHLLRYTLYNDRLGQRFLAKQQGQLHPQQYVSNAAGGIDPSEAGECVDEFTQRRITEDSHRKQAHATAEVIAAAEDVLQAVRERAESSPEFKREARLTMHRIRRELDRFIDRQKRKAA